MAILIDENTKILVQGITGNVGSFQAKIMQEYGTNIIAGVTPGKGGTVIHDIPVYDLVHEAYREHEINAAINFVPSRFAKDAALEAISCGISFLVITTEGIPDRDVLKLLHCAKANGTTVLGPDTPGLISPGKSKLGVHPHAMFMPGPVGIISKSGSLSYEVGRLLTANGIGQSSVVGIGGGPLWGMSQVDVLQQFEDDPETKIVILLGEVGGVMEHEAATFILEHMRKPTIALIVGRTAPPGTQMGHAGAIIEGNEGTAASKIEALNAAGTLIAKNAAEIPELINHLGV